MSRHGGGEIALDRHGERGVLVAGGMTLLLVPAILRMFGHHAMWFPKWLGRIVPHVDIEGKNLRTPPSPSAVPDDPAAPRTS